MTKQRALAVLLLLTLVAPLSLDLPAYQKSKGKGKGKQEQSQGSDKKGGKSDGSEDDTGPGKGRDKSDSDEDDGAIAPLFKGKMGLKSSSQSKDQATLGFNGVEPDGSLRDELLKAKPTPADEKKAGHVAALSVQPEALESFIHRGKLNEQQPQKKDKKGSK